MDVVEQIIDVNVFFFDLLQPDDSVARKKLYKKMNEWVGMIWMIWKITKYLVKILEDTLHLFNVTSGFKQGD